MQKRRNMLIRNPGDFLKFFPLLFKVYLHLRMDVICNLKKGKNHGWGPGKIRGEFVNSFFLYCLYNPKFPSFKEILRSIGGKWNNEYTVRIP